MPGQNLGYYAALFGWRFCKSAMGMGVRTVTSSENLAACGPSNVVLRKDKDIAADDYDCQTHACAYDMPMNSIRSDES